MIEYMVNSEALRKSRAAQKLETSHTTQWPAGMGHLEATISFQGQDSYQMKVKQGYLHPQTQQCPTDHWGLQKLFVYKRDTEYSLMSSLTSQPVPQILALNIRMFTAGQEGRKPTHEADTQKNSQFLTKPGPLVSSPSSTLPTCWKFHGL